MQNAPSYMFDRVIKTPLKALAQKYILVTAQNLKFSIKDFFSKCDQSRRKLRVWSHLLKKSRIENFIFYAVSLAKGES